jgi:hypothetical protein
VLQSLHVGAPKGYLLDVGQVLNGRNDLRIREKQGHHLPQILAVLKRGTLGHDELSKRPRHVADGRRRSDTRHRVVRHGFQDRLVEPDFHAKCAARGVLLRLRDRRLRQLDGDLPVANSIGLGLIFEPVDGVLVPTDGNEGVVHRGRLCVRKDDVGGHKVSFIEVARATCG